MSIENDIKDKNKIQLLDSFYFTGGTKTSELFKLALIARCTTDIETALKSLETAITKNSESGDQLSKKLFYLNIILTTATVAGVIIAFFKQ